MNLHEILLKQLDAQLEHWREANLQAPKPKNGWIRTIRKALGVTIIQLAKRLDLDPSRIVKIETAERQGNVTLKTLQEVAEALNCEFVYALVPKKPLKDLLLEKVRNVIKRRLERVSHSMTLEDQSVSKKYHDEKMEDLIKSVLSKRRRVSSVWNEPETNVSPHKRATKIGRRRPKGKQR